MTASADHPVLAEARAVLLELAGGLRRNRVQDGERITAIEESGTDEHETLQAAKELQRALFDRRLGWLSGPARYGGRDLSPAVEQKFDELVDEYQLPSRQPLFVGLHIVAPALLQYGGGALCDEFLPAIASGDVVGCQLFSEPDAGSDLASVTTSAVQSGEEWVINGQKVWTSGAHIADVGEVLVRTDRRAPKHAGMTMFLIDMDSPGVTVRPLRQITGGAAFNEVFLDDVHVHDRRRIGALNDGWSVANASLRGERGAMSGPAGPLSPQVLDRLRSMIEREGDGKSPVTRQQVAAVVAAVLSSRVAAERESHQWLPMLAPVAGPVQKLLMVNALDQIASVVSQVLGADAFIDSGRPDTYCWSEFVLSTPGLHLAGGTDEIQRTIIARRGLGMPAE